VTSWIWVNQRVVLALHDEQIAEHGGSSGLRDEGMLWSALSRPENKAQYEKPDVADLAAAYAYGIAKNHPFVDGNKRTALVVAEVFLQLNGRELIASDEDCLLTILSLAAGDIDEGALSKWFRQRQQPIAT
jgi:death on curing protein